MIVLKFGGTSVGTPQGMNQIREIITKDNNKKLVVLSALSGVTNTLVEIGERLRKKEKEQATKVIKKLQKRYDEFLEELFETESFKNKASAIIADSMDFIKSCLEKPFTNSIDKELLAQGELMSTNIFNLHLQEHELNSALINALDFVRTDAFSEPDDAFINKELSDILVKQPAETNLIITQGYICRNAEGNVDNLKRGGSDYTASLVGAALNADEIQIWTDIDGMHNNDPRVVEKTFSIPELSFEEAAELAYFGAKILHPSCIRPAQKRTIPVRLKNTMKPEAPGTLIHTKEGSGEGIKAIAAKDGIVAIKIKSLRMLMAYGFLRRVFEIFEKYKTPIDVITTSEVAISVTIDNIYYLDSILSELRPFGEVEVDQEQSIICLVGNMVAEKPGLVSKIFASLQDVPVRMISYGGSRHNISVVVDTQYKSEALKRLNDGVF
ncbi:aspartokinase [Marivirga tractuosa]|uniref:Aspartokinase n=1 Tax=Marivirga tractuosa (strain ATCC 23168 / DSM 4126 / NBRC 15989 / NCIMB 1408 / VKM B-1430 / H-43) TaxID=643867 RepID=E4TNS1_MARTH|nr:aspartate kinase [Marivirga tractuosa]ADR22485.1 aspartate kinase [Marivirga tractuosa DSM 4126]BDD16844.1 aspartokinase [Marivirga tractuosa]